MEPLPGSESLTPTALGPSAELHQRQRDHWDRLAATIPDLFPAPSTQYYRRREIALIRRCIGSLSGKRILKLDLWNEAFNTRILHWMQDQGAEVCGLDVSQVTISRACRNSLRMGDHLQMVQADIRQIPFADNSFDFVYTMGTIEHIDDYQVSLGEIRRVLREGGRAIVGVPHKWNIFLRPLMVRLLDLFGMYPYSPEKSFAYGELCRLLEEHDLRVRRRSGILAIPGILRMVDLFFFSRRIPFYQLTPILVWPFEYLERRWEWPCRLGYLLALVVEKAPSGPGMG